MYEPLRAPLGVSPWQQRQHDMTHRDRIAARTTADTHVIAIATALVRVACTVITNSLSFSANRLQVSLLAIMRTVQPLIVLTFTHFSGEIQFETLQLLFAIRSQSVYCRLAPISAIWS